MNSEEQQPTTAHSFTNYVASTIDSQDPWKDDKLKRKESSELLTKLLNNAHTPFTLVVNSPWGTGKTFFIERWHAAIKQEHFAFYFSAWEAEIHPQPMIAFLQEFKKEYESDPELFSKVDELWDDFFAKFLMFAVALPVLFKTVGTKIYDAAQQSELLKSILEIGGQKLKEKYESTFKDEIPTAASIRTSFGKLTEETANTYEKKHGSRHPIYIFIDELDRCRPDFAIRFLEEVKHLFCVPDIVFVLSLDLSQLNTSIKHIYGSGIACEGYLRRFVNQFYNLPEIPYENFVISLFRQRPVTNKQSYVFGQDIPWEKEFASAALAFKASLRDIECVYSRYYAICQTAQPKTVFPDILQYLLFVHITRPEAWESYRKAGYRSILPHTLISEGKIMSWKAIERPVVLNPINAACIGTMLDEKRSPLFNLPMQGSTTLSQQTELSKDCVNNINALKNQLSLVELYSFAFEYPSD